MPKMFESFYGGFCRIPAGNSSLILSEDFFDMRQSQENGLDLRYTRYSLLNKYAKDLHYKGNYSPMNYIKELNYLYLKILSYHNLLAKNSSTHKHL